MTPPSAHHESPDHDAERIEAARAGAQAIFGSSNGARSPDARVPVHEPLFDPSSWALRPLGVGGKADVQGDAHDG